MKWQFCVNALLLKKFSITTIKNIYDSKKTRFNFRRLTFKCMKIRFYLVQEHKSFEKLFEIKNQF